MIAGNCSIYQSFSFMCKIDSIFCTISKWFSIIPQNKVMGIAQIKYICFINGCKSKSPKCTNKAEQSGKKWHFQETHFPCVHDSVLWFYYFRYSGNNGTCQKKSLKLSKLKYWCNCNLDRTNKTRYLQVFYSIS